MFGCWQVDEVQYCISLLLFLLVVESDAEKVKKNLEKKSTEGYEAALLTHNNTKQRRPKKVYCYISPKQLTIKEFYLKIIPKRLQTFRVCPATKVRP